MTELLGQSIELSETQDHQQQDGNVDAILDVLGYVYI